MSIKNRPSSKTKIIEDILDTYQTEFQISYHTKLRSYFNNFLKLIIDNVGIYIEYPYVEKQFRDSYYSYFSTKHPPYFRDCLRISFFEGEVTLDDFRDIQRIEDLKKRFLGFMTLRPFDRQFVGRTVLSPRLYKNNEFICCLVRYHALVNGVKLTVYGFPYCSQDGELLTCAETTVLNLMEYFGFKYPEYAPILPSDIISTLSEVSFERLIPSEGLHSQNISFLLKEFGFATKVYFCDDYKSYEFNFIINSYVESGIPIIASLQKGKGNAHAVIICGRSLKLGKDILIKLKEKIQFPYYFAELINNYVLIDDNVTPYQVVPLKNPTLNYSDEEIKGATIKSIIVPLYQKVYVDAFLAKKFIKLVLAEKGLIDDSDFFITKIFLASSRTFKYHISTSDMDRTFKDLIINKRMPKFVWVAEGYRNFEDLDKQRVNSLIVVDATDPKLDVTHLLFIVHKGEFVVYKSVNNNYSKLFVSLQTFNTFTSNLKGIHTKWQD